MRRHELPEELLPPQPGHLDAPTWGKLQVRASRQLAHFIELARRGRNPAASGGEQRAARLAAALLDDVAGIDQDAVAGLTMFARVVAANWSAASSLIEDKGGR